VLAAAAVIHWSRCCRVTPRVRAIWTTQMSSRHSTAARTITHATHPQPPHCLPVHMSGRRVVLEICSRTDRHAGTQTNRHAHHSTWPGGVFTEDAHYPPPTTANHPTVYLSICLSICLSMRNHHHTHHPAILSRLTHSVCLSVPVSVCLSLCVCVCVRRVLTLFRLSRALSLDDHVTP